MHAGRRFFTVLAAAAVAAALLVGVGSTAQGVAIPAQIVDIAPPVSYMSHAGFTWDYGSSEAASDDRQGTTRWRVVKNTGNCCENHLGITKEGRLFDIGGSYVNYSDDRGATWKSVRPLNPLVNGEGSIAVAPNGDVLAIEWDAYTGDHLLAYKYNAVSGKWFTMENVLHHPVYDRPWITVVPGPFAVGVGADTVPYITVVQGGTGVKDPMFVSTDGLTYAEPSGLTLDGLTDTPTQQYFPITADASFDWIQPIRRSPVTPLGAGRAAHVSGWLLDPADRKWDSWRLPGGATPPDFIQIDSAGRIHHVRGVGGGLEYRISADGARTWTSKTYPLAFGSLTDLKVNLAAGIGAVATRANHQDWVYKFDIEGAAPRLIRKYRVGLGDNPAGSSVGALTSPRMDFQSVVIFPDGRVAATFLDSSTLSTPPGTGALGRITPALVVEVDTELPPHKPDLTAGGLAMSTVKARGADQATFSARIANAGLGAARGVGVRFVVDGAQLGAEQTIAELAAGGSATVTSAAWSAKQQSGNHTVQVVVDPGGAIAEADETNNAATRTFFVEGNKIQNGSFETDADASGSPDSWSSSGTAGYEGSGSDGQRSVSAGPGGTWTSAPVAVEPGKSYEASVAAFGAGGTLAVQQLAADGRILATAAHGVLPTMLYGLVSLPVTALDGAAQVRIVLIGGLGGTTTFDDVWLEEG